MKNYVLTVLLAVLVVLASMSLRRAIAANGDLSNNAATLVAIGPGPAPIPHVMGIGPGPAPIPHVTAIGPGPAPIPHVE